ncbi:MAG: diguanylate cyclase [Treponema sp.]|jgi:diguanylate cyclase (GGDEF)-like protein|nr:diguanylate cyclase [Treponema sp.]
MSVVSVSHGAILPHLYLCVNISHFSGFKPAKDLTKSGFLVYNYRGKKEMAVPRKNNLLIVDDDSSNLMALSYILSEYVIYTAKNGTSAIEKAEKYLPDLVLLDIIMSDMNGYEVLAALKESDKTKHIPVIFITGLNNIEDEKKGLELGAIDYISKPFDEIIVKLRVQLHIRIINQLRTIEYLSTTDQLTELPNRRAFDNRLSMEWGRALRESVSISIMVADVDHFKIYNDTYGHQQGDMALQNVAKIISQTLKRPADFAARWGGEEFVVLLPNTDSRGALEIGENICKNVATAEIPCDDGSLTKLTISIGVNTQIPERETILDKFILDADKALYTAKDTGRNRVCLYDSASNAVKGG